MNKLRAFTAILLLFGCSTPQKELMSDLNIDFPKSSELTQIAEYNGLDLYNPISFVVKDSLLFVLERGGECLGRCFNINTSEEISKFLFKGKSSTEMIQAEYLSLYGDDSINVISGNYPSMVKTYPLSVAFNKRDYSTNCIEKPNNISSFYFDKLSDNTILGMGQEHQSDKGKYFILSPNGLETFGEYDQNLFTLNTQIDSYNIMNWDSYIAFHSSREKVALASRIGLLIEVVNLKAKSLDSWKYYDKIEMKVEKVEGGVSKSMGSNRRAVAIGCTDKNVIVSIFETIKVSEERKSPLKNYSLLVFDWKLNPVKQYKIAQAPYLQHISQDGKFLYTLIAQDNGEKYSLMKYSIE